MKLTYFRKQVKNANILPVTYCLLVKWAALTQVSYRMRVTAASFPFSY